MMVLMIMLQMVNHLIIKKIVGKTPRRPERPAQPPHQIQIDLNHRDQNDHHNHQYQL